VFIAFKRSTETSGSKAQSLAHWRSGSCSRPQARLISLFLSVDRRPALFVSGTAPVTAQFKTSICERI